MSSYAERKTSFPSPHRRAQNVLSSRDAATFFPNSATINLCPPMIGAIDRPTEDDLAIKRAMMEEREMWFFFLLLSGGDENEEEEEVVEVFA